MKCATIIGLVGFGSVGKDTVSRHLEKKHGYTHVSSGDLLRLYMRKNNLGLETRSALQDVGNKLRAEHGADYLSVLALQNPARPIVVSGLRAVPEVSRIKKEGGIVIALSAPIETRYTWASGRGGIADKVSFEEFKIIEEREANNNSEGQQNIKAVIKMADFHIENNGSRGELLQSIDHIIEECRVQNAK